MIDFLYSCHVPNGTWAKGGGQSFSTNIMPLTGQIVTRLLATAAKYM